MARTSFSRLGFVTGLYLAVNLASLANVRSAGEVLPNLGGMLPPELDEREKPFSYFWHPTDLLGTYLAPAATAVTPEGYLYNGFGDLMFFLGNPPEPVQQRIRTLYRGSLPIVQYEIERDEILYTFTCFASDLGGSLARLPVNFMRVTARNVSSQPRAAFVSSAYRFSAPGSDFRGGADYRFSQNMGALPARLTNGQVNFNPAWKYQLTSDSLERDDRVLYLFSNDPPPYQTSLSLGRRAQSGVRFLSGQVEMGPVETSSSDPLQPLGFVTYRWKLAPGEEKSADFKYPIIPLPVGSEEIAQVRAASYDEEFKRMVRFWETKVVQKMPLHFPEAKVQDALLANTCYALLSVNQVDGTIIPVCNKFQYNSHPMGYVTSHIVMALAEFGYEALAMEGALYDVKLQAPNGQWGKGHYWGYFGENAVTWGRLFALTHDKEFLRQVYPALMRGAHRIAEVVSGDSEGVLPPITLDDDEMLQDTRFTGQNVRTLQGLLFAIEMAKAMGESKDTAFLQEFYATYRAAFDRLLEKQTEQTKGVIPPALDVTTQGNNWDNLQLLHPQPLFAAFDPRISATIAYTRGRYREGILPYLVPYAIGETGGKPEFNTRNSIHYWQSFNNSFSALVRGGAADQRDAVQDLYALLLHTTSTHAPQEYGTLPWGTRDFSIPSNITPMMATSARLMSFLRAMLVREEADTLNLLSAVSPAWLEKGKDLRVDDLLTTFGKVSFSLEATDSGWLLQLDNQFHQPPRELRLRLPWFVQTTGLEVDGQTVELPAPRPGQPREIVLPLTAKSVKVLGTSDPAWAKNFNYQTMVAHYQETYARAYQRFLETGEVELRSDPEIDFGLKAPEGAAESMPKEKGVPLVSSNESSVPPTP